MPAPVPHHLAGGIHPGAFVQSTEPDTTDVQEGVLWVVTSGDPPFALKVWRAAVWQQVGLVSADTAIDGTGHLLTDCLTFANGATVCADGDEKITIHTPSAAHSFDLTGYTLPGGHRLEVAAP